MSPLSSSLQDAVLGGRYQLNAERDHSNHVQHWAGQDQTLGRPVSVILVSGDTVAATLDAARRVSVVNDSRLSQILDIGHYDHEGTELGFVVHEDLTGQTLADLATQGPIAAEVARSVIGEIAHTLEVAAKAGLHHQTITAQHILQTEAGDLRLLGTAIEAAAAGVDETDGDAAARQDAVDLVKVLYLCLTSRSVAETSGQPPQRIVSSVPADLDTLCVTTLGPHDDGPISPAELASALRPWSRVPDSIVGTAILAPVTVPAQRPEPSEAAEAEATSEASATDPASGDAGEHTEPETPDAPAGSVDSGQVDTEPQQDPQTAPEPDTGTPDTTDDTTPNIAAAAAGATAAAVGAAAAAKATTERPESTAEHEERDSLPFVTSAIDPDADEHTQAALSDTQNPLTTSQILSGGVGLSSFTDRVPDARPAAYFPGGSISTDAAEQSAPGWQRPAQAVTKAEHLPPFEQVMGTHQFAAAPLSRRSSTAGAKVIAVFSAIVIVALLAALITFFSGRSNSSDPAKDQLKNPDSTPTFEIPEETKDSGESATASPTETGPAKPVTIKSVTAFDPEGDDKENDAQAKKAIDSSKSTFWPSASYKSASFGGLKTGVGLIVQADSGTKVSKITVTDRNSGGVIEVREMTGQTLARSKVLGKITTDGSAQTFTLDKPISDAKLLLWYTTLPKAKAGRWRAEVADVSME